MKQKPTWSLIGLFSSLSVFNVLHSSPWWKCVTPDFSLKNIISFAALSEKLNMHISWNFCLFISLQYVSGLSHFPTTTPWVETGWCAYRVIQPLHKGAFLKDPKIPLHTDINAFVLIHIECTYLNTMHTMFANIQPYARINREANNSKHPH